MIAYLPIMLVSIVLNSLAQIFMRKAMLNLGALTPSFEYVLKALTNLWLLACLACYGLSIITWMAVLAKVHVSIAQPISAGLAFILTLSIAYFTLGEPIGAYKIIGVLFVLVGIIFLSLAKQ